MASLRAKLLLGTIVGSAVVLAVAGVAVYALVRDGLVEQMDLSLEGKARLLTSAVEQKGRGIGEEFHEFDMSEFRHADGPGFLQLWREDGSALYRSESLGKGDLPGAGGKRGEAPSHRWVTLPNGRPARAVVTVFLARTEDMEEPDRRGRDVGPVPPAVTAAILRESGGRPTGKVEREEEDGSIVYEVKWVAGGQKTEIKIAPDGTVLKRETAPAGRGPAGRHSVTLALARDARPLQATLASVRNTLLLVGLAAVGVSSAILWLIVGRSLVPVRTIADRIGSLGEESLSERLAPAEAPKELRPIVGRLNGLLGRLEGAFRRERSFSADVAHELRTPLAGLRTTMEVALTRQRGPAEYEEAIRDSLHIALQLQGMVENLLFLARLEANHAERDCEPVRLDELAGRLWAPLAEGAAARQVRVARATQPASARTDATLAALVVRNVLENAAAYVDDRGTVEIATGADADARTAWLRVANSGSRISPRQVGMVFDRFWRDDAARTAAGVHCGLGLSLVKRAVAVLGGTVKVASEAGGVFEITVSLPCTTDSPAGG